MRHAAVVLVTLLVLWLIGGDAAQRGDPVYFTDLDTLDVPVLRVGGVDVATTTGGGGGSNELSPALVATTGNITLTGEQTIDGQLTAASSVLVWRQTTGSQNGVYTSAAGAWTRRADADTGAELAGHPVILVTGGTRYAGTVFRIANTGAITIGTTSISIIPEPTQWHVLAAQTIVAGGAIGCNPPTGQFIGAIAEVAGSGGAVSLGNPQITAGVRPNQLCLVQGTSATNTVSISDGTGVLLTQAPGPVTLTNRLSIVFRWTGTVWRQVDQAGATGGAASRIFTADETTPVRIQNAAATTTLDLYVDSVTNDPVIKCTKGGGGCDQVFQLSAGKDFSILKDDGTTLLFNIDNDTGTITPAPGGGAAPVQTTVAMRLMTVEPNGNAFVETIDGTNFDYTGVRFLDNAVGTTYWKALVPTNLATTPAWNLVITHKAMSGAGGDIVLNVESRDYPTNSSFDQPLTAMHTNFVVLNQPPANVRVNALTTSGGYDGVQPIGAGNFLVVMIQRDATHASDTTSADWLLIDVQLRANVN